MEELVDYDVVSEFAGHQKNVGVTMVDAVKDIFKKVKENSMQLAVKGEFKSFKTIEELQSILSEAMTGKFSIRCYDENIGG